MIDPASSRAGDPEGTEEVDARRWRDRGTGLVVVPAPTEPLHRVFQMKYSALDPRIPTGDRASWSRWDVLDHVTLYGADTDVAALVEALAYAKPARFDLATMFPDVAAGEDPAAADWRELGHLPRGQVARAWRVTRELITLRLRPGAVGWFVDVGHAETIAVLRREVAAWSPDAALLRDPTRVDTSLLAGGRRDVTTAVAGWLRARVLGDGSQPAGVRFTSKHGQNLVCWALWVPLVGATEQGEVPALVRKAITVEPPVPLLEDTPALLAASRLLGVRVH